MEQHDAPLLRLLDEMQHRLQLAAGSATAPQSGAQATGLPPVPTRGVGLISYGPQLAADAGEPEDGRPRAHRPVPTAHRACRQPRVPIRLQAALVEPVHADHRPPLEAHSRVRVRLGGSARPGTRAGPPGSRQQRRHCRTTPRTAASRRRRAPATLDSSACAARSTPVWSTVRAAALRLCVSRNRSPNAGSRAGPRLTRRVPGASSAQIGPARGLEAGPKKSRGPALAASQLALSFRPCIVTRCG